MNRRLSNERRELEQELQKGDFIRSLSWSTLTAAGARCCYVAIAGPVESLYEGGTWRLGIFVPAKYPFEGPTISFLTPIEHANVELISGLWSSLQYVEQNWSPASRLCSLLEELRQSLSALRPGPYTASTRNPELWHLSRIHPDEFENRVRWNAIIQAGAPLRVTEAAQLVSILVAFFPAAVCPTISAFCYPLSLNFFQAI